MPRSLVLVASLAAIAACAHTLHPTPSAVPVARGKTAGPSTRPACARPIPRKAVSGPGYTDLAAAGAGLLAASADGTIRLAGDPARPVVARLPGPVLGLAVAPGGREVAAVGFGFVARSGDGGRHFTATRLPGDVATFAAAFRGDDLLVLDGAAHLWRIGPAGAATAAGALPPGTRFALRFASPTLGYAAGACGHLLKTSDGGRTFTALASPAASLEGLLAWGQTVVVSGTGGVWRSDDEGAHFTQVVHARACVRMARAGTAIAVACSRLDHALWYADDGRHFREVPTPDASALLAAYVGPGGVLFAAGAHGVLMRGRPAGLRVANRSDPPVAAWLKLLRLYRKAHPRRPSPAHRTPAPKKPAPSRPPGGRA